MMALKNTNRLLLSAVLISGFFLTGCTNPSEDLKGVSGYHNNYDGFVKGQDGGVELIRGKPGSKISTELAKYEKIMISPIIVWQGEDETRFQGITKEELAEITKIFRQELVNAVHDRYEVVDKPANDVMKLDIALTGLIASNPNLDGALIIVPFMPFITKTEELVSGKQSYVGATSIEGAMRDSVSNEELVAFVDTQIGKRIYQISTTEDDLNDPYRYSKISFKWWASRLRYVLDSTRID